MKKYRVCAFLMVLSMLFSTLSVGVSASSIESECFVSCDNATRAIQYEYYSVTEQDDVFYSPPGEGDAEMIEEVYNQINEMRTESISDTGLISTFSIIGSDGRTKVDAEICKPYSRICYLEMVWADGYRARGTGWLYARDRVATAGHCVYDKEHGGWAATILVQPGRYQDYAPFGETWSLQMQTSQKWIDNEDSEYDYAFLRLRDPVGDVSGFFGYGAGLGSVGTKVNIAGYPGDKNTGSSRNQWQMRGRITLVTARNLYYLIDTAEGQSGAPIYNENNTVIGIHTTGGTISNYGTRLTNAMVQVMRTW